MNPTAIESAIIPTTIPIVAKSYKREKHSIDLKKLV
jgi:hypothetical protein